MLIVQIMIEENILKFIDSISSSDRNDYKNVCAYHIFYMSLFTSGIL